MRLWVSLSLTAVLAFAGLANAQESGCLTVKDISASHHAVQQGGDIEISAKLVTVQCGIPVDVNEPKKNADLSLEVQEGFDASRPVVEIGGFEEASVGGSTWMGHAVTARFTLHAFREAWVGEHTIPATLTYTAQDSNGDIASRTLVLSIPVRVARPPAKPGFWNEHAEARKTLVTTGEVLVIIILWPALMIGSILGFYRWDC